MGLPTPSDDEITITSNTSKLRGNKNVSVSMRMIDNNNAFDSTADSNFTMTLSSIGGFECDFDIQEDTDDLSQFYVNVPTFEFSFWSELSDGIDFGDVLKQLTYDDLVEVKFSYDGNDDYFLCQKIDFEYDLLGREVTCKSYSPLKYGDLLTTTQISDFDMTPYDTVNYYEGGSATLEYNCLTLKDLINAYLDSFGSSGSNKIQSNYTLQRAQIADIDTMGESEGTNIYTTNTFQNGTAPEQTDSVVIEGASHQYYIDSVVTARERILEASIAEAALFGNLFGEPFYIRRGYSDTGDTDYFVDISSSDLEEFNIKFHSSAVNSVSLGVSGETASTSSEDSNAPLTITITIPIYTLQTTITWDSGDARREITTSGGELPITDVTDDGLQAYRSALGAKDSILWSGTIFGVDKVKPYQFIRLDTGISDFINSGNQKIRFTNVKYDFEGDRIEFEAYSI